MSKTFLAAFFVAIRKGNLNVVRNALAEGADPNSRDKYDLTPLIWSARKGHFDIFSELLKAGADLNVIDTTGRTFLHQCVLFKKHDFLRQALGVPVVTLDAADMHGFTALDVAIADDNRRCADLLKRAGAKAQVYSKSDKF